MSADRSLHPGIENDVKPTGFHSVVQWCLPLVVIRQRVNSFFTHHSAAQENKLCRNSSLVIQINC